MDQAELIKQLLTVSGPLGVLAYGMFWHHSKVQAAHAITVKAIADERVADAKDYAARLIELTADRKADRDLLVAVVRENSAAVTALVTKIDGLGWHHQRASDTKHDGSRNL
jgi:hypothetical protein